MDHAKKKKMKSTINFYFYAVVGGTVLTYSSLVALQTLQTSVNIEGNAGSIALTSAYIATITYSIFVAPALLQKFGIGFNLILTDVCFALYSLSNFYPELYVLVPGAIISGVARATSLPVTAMATFQLADMFGNVGSEEKSYYVNRYQGRFLGMFNSVAIIGNCISFAILYAGESDPPTPEPPVAGSITTILPATAFSTRDARNGSQYDFCGVNDCQDPAVVSQNIDQYVPPNKTSMYTLVGVTTLICVVAVFIHAFLYPGIGRFKREPVVNESSASSSKKKEQICESGESHCSSDDDESGYANGGFQGTEVPSNIDRNSVSESAEKYSSSDDKDEDRTDIKFPGSDSERKCSRTETSIQGNEKHQKESYYSTLKKTGLFFVKFKAVLLSFTSMRAGMIVGIVLSDFTRAYASCVAGVEVTALIAMTFGAVGIPASLAYAWGVKYVGRNVIMGVSYFVEMAVYVGCYVWVPDPGTIVFVYLIFIGSGVVSGVLRPLVTTTYDAYFPEDKHIAVNVWNFWMQAGVGLQYGLSTTMCMVDKIYLTAAFTTFSVITYAAVEVLHSRETKRGKETEYQVEGKYTTKL